MCVILSVFTLNRTLFVSSILIKFWYYRQTSNISRTLVVNKLVDHPNVVGAAPTNRHSWLDTLLQWNGQRQLQDVGDETHLLFWILCVLYKRFYGMQDWDPQAESNPFTSSSPRGWGIFSFGHKWQIVLRWYILFVMWNVKLFLDDKINIGQTWLVAAPQGVISDCNNI